MNTYSQMCQWQDFWHEPLQTPSVGIGFKPRYFPALHEEQHQLSWLEIHAENYMMEGGPIKAQLAQLAQHYPISCHGVGLSIGSAHGLNDAHLARLKTLCDWLQPHVFSEHLAWSSHQDHYLNDLLPVPYTQAVLNQVVDHIHQVQDLLGRNMLLENPATYVMFADAQMHEVDFINEIIERSGCGLLLDINNVYVTATNHNLDARAYIKQLPLAKVGEIHLAGHAVDNDEQGDSLLIDSHNAPVCSQVWDLYAYALSLMGWRPTLIEWDQDLPDFTLLHEQACCALTHMQQSISQVA